MKRKTIKRIFFVIVIVFLVALIGYLYYTGSQLAALEMVGIANA